MSSFAEHQNLGGDFEHVKAEGLDLSEKIQ